MTTRPSSAADGVSVPVERTAVERRVRDCETVDALAMHLLAAHIPLTLLLDLAENFGPPSTQISATEVPVGEDARWLVGSGAARS